MLKDVEALEEGGVKAILGQVVEINLKDRELQKLLKVEAVRLKIICDCPCP